MSPDFLLYGSTGYTGSLIAEQALKAGLEPVLAGRNERKLKAQAQRLDCTYRAFHLDDRPALENALADTPAVLHCAGPFIHTFQPVVEGCLRLGKHYVDLTGELRVFETLAAMHLEAQQAGVTLLPGAGFDVTPSDCLAFFLKGQMPEATHLALATIPPGAGATHGTLLSAIEALPTGGAIRKDGRLERYPIAGRSRRINFGRGVVCAILLPLADLTSAYASTGILNIETYVVLHRAASWLLPRVGRLSGVLSARPSRWLLRHMVQVLPSGPSPEARQRARSWVWGEVRSDSGPPCSAVLDCPEAYQLTALAAIAAMQRVCRGEVLPGFQTPAKAFGSDFILELGGSHRKVLES